MSLTIPHTIANGGAADGNEMGANFAAIKAWADTTDTAVSASVPVGQISLYGGGVAPTGYLLCRGQEADRATYADLFAIVGTSYGVGDGSTTFNLPDLQGAFPVGMDSGITSLNGLGKTGGSMDAVVIDHTHSGPSHTHGFSATTDNDTHTHDIDHDHGSANTGSGGSHDHGSQGNGYATSDGGITQWYATATASALKLNFYLATDSDGAHTHSFNMPPFTGSSDSDTHNHGVSGTTDAAGTGVTGSTGVDGTELNMPPYLVVNFIIKH